MSHAGSTSREYVPGHDKGDFINPAQAASFTTDPLLTPITASALPKPIHPDPSPSDNPELFDKSTGHPNSHYNPAAKLSKKKRAKKLGLGYVAPHAAQAQHAGGHTFSAHEKEAHERAERRDAALGVGAEQGEEEEWETDEEGDEEQEAEQSHKQHHENRVTGTESGERQPSSKKNDDAPAKSKDQDQDKEGGDEQDKDKEKGDNPSLIQRASNVLSSAQQKATGMASSVTSSVISTAQAVPVVGSLLSKVGLGVKGADDKEEGDKEVDSHKVDQPSQDKEGAKEAGKYATHVEKVNEQASKEEEA